MISFFLYRKTGNCLIICTHKDYWVEKYSEKGVFYGTFIDKYEYGSTNLANSEVKMKRLLFLVITVLSLSACGIYARERNADITFGYFYSTLVPYGEWIELDNDLYAWQPYNVGRAWQPYTVGRWVWSDYGWYWDSYEPFGWAVYHYGRWYNDEYYGWIWIPDENWGPSWVEWRYSDDYIGWAPLPPYAVFRAGIGIHFTFDWHCGPRQWNYVRFGHFHDYNVYNYLIPDRVKLRVYDVTRYRNDYDYRDGRVINRGVDRSFVERRSGTPVVERRIEEVSRLRDFEGTRRNRDDRRNANRIEVFRPSQQDISSTRDIGRMDIRRSNKPTSLELSRVENREIVRESRRAAMENERGIREEKPRTETRNDNTDRRNRVINPEARSLEEKPGRTNIPNELEHGKQPDARSRDRRFDSNVPDNPGRIERNEAPERSSNENRPQIREKRAEEQRSEERKAVEPRRQERRSEEPRSDERRIERSRPQERPAAEGRNDAGENRNRQENNSRNDGGRRR